MNNEIVKKLKESLGFSDKKVAIFLSVLELGETSATRIAQKAKVKRTTVYNILPELIVEGLVGQTKSVTNKRYFVIDPRIISKLLSQKLEAVNSILPSLLAIQSLSVGQPKIYLIEGESGLRNLYEETITTLNKGDWIYSFAGNIKENYIKDQDLESYIKKRTEKGIRNKIIVTDSSYEEILKKNDLKELREVKRIKTDVNVKIPSVDIKIYGNKIALISYRENFLGVIIESKDISDMAKILFQSFWNLVQ